MMLFQPPASVVFTGYLNADGNGTVTISDCYLINTPINESASSELRVAPGLSLQTTARTLQITHTNNCFSGNIIATAGSGHGYIHPTNHPEPQTVHLYLVHRRFNV
ncbi:MAG: hypothetical protein IH591_02760 [Bacteroidales bacterium]|nr:hypothetical protein [Bacteroidales bacterium]